MTKYSKALEVQIAQRYLMGRDGFKILSQELGYRMNRCVPGAEIFNPSYTVYSPAFKLEVLNDMATNELSRLDAALKYHISSLRMISNWRIRV